MRFEINCSINAGDLLDTNLMEKKLLLTSYAGEKNNANHEEDFNRIRPSRIHCLLLSSLCGSAPGIVRWFPSLALGILVEAVSNPVCGSLLQTCLDHLFCPAVFPSALGL